MTKKYTIYALCEPEDTKVRYIGATHVSPRARYSQIKYGFKRGQFQDVGAWIWGLLNEGKEPIIISLEENAPDGINGEKRWISAYRASGAELFNKSAGGQGTNGVLHTEEWKRNNSLLLTGQKRSTETKARIAASKIGKSRPDLAARNKSNRRLSPEDLEGIRYLIDQGDAMVDIGAAYGVSGSLICLIKNGKRYAP